MAKPDVQISAAHTLVVGMRQLIDIDVTVEKDTKVERIDAWIESRQGWSVGSGKNRVSHRVIARLGSATLMGAGVLPPATTTRFTFPVTLPHGVPPSHRLDPAYAELYLRIQIAIPWRIDPRYHYLFSVRLPPPPHVERTPVVMRGTPLTAAPDKPRIELSVASTRLIAGETLVGSLAVFHLDDKKPRDVELSFVPMLSLLGRGRARERRGRPFGTTVTVPAGSAGTSIPFQVRLPHNMTPSFEAATHQLSWWLVAMTGSFFGPKVDVSVPLEIVDAQAASYTKQLVAAPRLGDERSAAIFATVAARAGWRGGDPGDADDRLAGDFAIERELAGSLLRIAYAYRGEEGTFLVAAIDHEELGLGLAVTPSSALRHVFWKDVEVDVAAWDRAHHVVARAAEQTIPFLQAVVPTLMQSGRLGSLVRWDDSVIVFEKPIANVDETELSLLAGELERLALAIAGARAGIQPPPGVAIDLAAWHELAHALEGSVTVGDLGIHGVVGSSPVDIAVEWEESAPRRVRVHLGDPEHASAAAREVVLSLAHPSADVLARGAEKLADQLASWPADIVELQIQDGVVSAALVLERAEIDPKRVRQLVDALRTIQVSLDPGAGPYR
ncbi:MAG TPA: hypothetical protein VFQ53_10505 [Kofleriaceae bacterium]|nr:hypothetical protein [Kofleriaceae bacterium]